MSGSFLLASPVSRNFDLWSDLSASESNASRVVMICSPFATRETRLAMYTVSPKMLSPSTTTEPKWKPMRMLMSYGSRSEYLALSSSSWTLYRRPCHLVRRGERAHQLIADAVNDPAAAFADHADDNVKTI